MEVVDVAKNSPDNAKGKGKVRERKCRKSFITTKPQLDTRGGACTNQLQIKRSTSS
jgi:hypothetical protein